MERQHILNVLTGTLEPNYEVRKQAEVELAKFEQQPGFTAYCLSLSCDGSISLGQRISASIFFKNRISYYWNVDNDKGIKLQEQEEIKVQIIDALLKSYNDSHIRPQLTTALRNILNRGTWDLNPIINQLLNEKTDISKVFIGLVLLYEATRNLRFNQADRTLLDSYINQTFPILEELISNLIPQTDYKSGELLYMIFKVFKYSILAALPQYLFDPSKLSTWISLHLHVIQKPDAKEVLDLDPVDRSLDKRVKARKWAFANLHKYYGRYGTPMSKVTTPEYISFFNKTYVNEILNVYFQLVEKWSQGYWIDDSSLFHLISFFEKAVMCEGWEYLEPHYDSILRHLLFPALCQQNLELFEEDPEEYIRRFFDVNRDSKTPDVATVDVLFVTVHHKFEKLPLFLNLLNEVFSTFQSAPSLENALKAEGGLRILSSISFVLGKDKSPVKDQIDQIIGAFVVPQLTSNFEFLRARSCETISIFSHQFTDKDVLSKVFQGVYSNFQNDDNVVIQIEAADALKVLINDPLVVDAIKNDVPQIMSKLLLLSKNFDLDMIGEVMEEFVINFSVELEPFAKDLAANLTEQFVNAATELVELQSSGSSDDSALDKEYQAVGYIKTLTSMIVYMPKVNLEEILIPIAAFVIENAAISFLGEAMELLECLTLNSKTISPAMWEIFKNSIDSFQTYAADYLEYYIAFFENVITYGFKGLNYESPQVVLLQNVLNELITSPIDYDKHGAFELLEYTTLTLNAYNPLFPLGLQELQKGEISDYAISKLFLANLKVNPGQTLEVLESTGLTIRILEIWYRDERSLENVYCLKLQLYALLSLFQLPTLPLSLEGFIPQLAVKLIGCLQKLPAALNKAQASYQKEKEQSTIAGQSNPISADDAYEDEFDDEYEDEDDDFKDNPLTECNVYQEFEAMLLNVKNVNEQRFRVMIGGLNDEMVAVLRNVLSVEGQMVLGR